MKVKIFKISYLDREKIEGEINEFLGSIAWANIKEIRQTRQDNFNVIVTIWYLG